ncbi:MAG: exodeoxyribonuclease V subunit alpha [Chlamydiales bacterium]|nr:exodeoxyribonuclease V subunit alpha [Chlamydiales bacterium]
MKTEKLPFSEIDNIFAASLIKDGSREQHLFMAALLWASRQGHLSLPAQEEELLELFALNREIASAILKGSREIPSELLDEKGLDLPRTPLCRFKHYYYLQKNWVFETRFLKQLEKLLALKAEAFSASEEEDLTEEQNRAVAAALSLPFSLLCGGPGTGKTYTAARIVRAFRKKHKEARIALAAPTGKAAKQLQLQLIKEDIRVETLHALLEVHRESDFFSAPSPVMADLLIVDECSMIDARLFSRLLESLHQGAHLVLMGDPYQLPPVESGTLFADLVDVLKGGFSQHLTELTRWLRSDRQEILRFAEAVKSGKAEEAWRLLSGSEEGALHYLELGEGPSAFEAIWNLVSKRFPQPSTKPIDHAALWAEKESCALLSCLRKGPFGVDQLNEMIAERFTSRMGREEHLAVPILITRTDPELGLYNGETGILIRRFSGEGEYAIFGPAPFREIPASRLPAYEYAYALSVHKSQGSEYEDVLLLVGPGSEYFGKEVIYTGATRSKKSLTILSRREVLESSLARASRKISALHARLQKTP